MSETDIQRASTRSRERERRRARQEGQRAARQKSSSLGSGGGAHVLAASAFGKPRPPRRPGCLIHRAMGPTPNNLRARTKIRVGSDFSGMEAGVTALKRMGVPFTLAFSSDNDPSCQKFIRKVHKPKVLFEDITTRRPEEECDVDLYLWTPPCQSFL